jgi:ATP-binding cassette subfamily B protein
MIAIAIITSALSVVQTYISNEVGQRVMHDLRVRSIATCRGLSLAFFTRTRSGEVQSRIANDIGGIDDVVTSTRDLDQSRRWRPSRRPSWRCSALTGADVVLLDSAAVLRVADAPRRQRAPRDPVGAAGPLADMSTLVEESLSVSGILLGKTMGRSHELVDALLLRVERTGRPRGARADGRALADGLGADELRDHARRSCTGSRATTSPTPGRDLDRHVVAFTTLQTRLLFPMRSCCRWAWKCRPRWRCSGGSSSTSTCRSTSSSAPARAR